MLISINDKTFPLTIIRKKSSLEKGLKGKKYIEGCHLFMMGDNGMNSFWMKDCLVPLDIVFCHDNEIKKIYHDCPPCDINDCPKYEHSGNIVLEFAGGTCKNHSITEGDVFSVLM